MPKFTLGAYGAVGTRPVPAIGLLVPDEYGEAMARPGRALTGGKSAGKIRARVPQTRDRIVAAAAELMFEGGVAGTTMEMVRAAARVSSSQTTTTSRTRKPWSGR